MANLAGKTAVVTGASRGIGRASALALAAAGAQVLVHYGRGGKEADSVVAEIRKAGGRADAIATDLAAADGASKRARQTRSIVGDRLDILVANAGVSKAATIEETTRGFRQALCGQRTRIVLSLCSNCFRSYAREAASFSCRRSRPARLPVRSRRMQPPRARSTLW
jgi:NAD(P)-dependent dehydrogenase (short-subunit alcohol dehydrogenase family)